MLDNNVVYSKLRDQDGMTEVEYERRTELFSDYMVPQVTKRFSRLHKSSQHYR